jgi:hypothetical protein
LRVSVGDNDGTVAGLFSRDGEVNGGSGFAGAAFLVGNDDGFHLFWLSVKHENSISGFRQNQPYKIFANDQMKKRIGRIEFRGAVEMVRQRALIRGCNFGLR